MVEGSVTAKRAIEALRSGVPNRDAVRELGTSQEAIATRFDDLLAAASGERPAGGMVISGDFGTGKSHLLEYLQHVALDRGFVASRVIISRETPLYDPAKVLRAALENARIPDRRGAALPEIAERFFDGAGTPPYDAFVDWVNRPASGLNERFPASLYLYQNTHEDLELRDRIVRFWGGDPIAVTDLRRPLREMGEGATWAFSRAAEKELAVQRFRFVARLMQAAGYGAWAILFDEVELIGRYSLLQRARSYAEVARWVDPHDTDAFAGIAAVLAKSTDFDAAVIDQRGDRELAPNRLRARGGPDDDVLADRAEEGVDLLYANPHRLVPPDERLLQATHARLRRLHGEAYGWSPPALTVEVKEMSFAMRQYVRVWINEWDLRRLYPDYRPDFEFEAVPAAYGEDADYEGEETVDVVADD